MCSGCMLYVVGTYTNSLDVDDFEMEDEDTPNFSSTSNSGKRIRRARGKTYGAYHIISLKLKVKLSLMARVNDK